MFEVVNQIILKDLYGNRKALKKGNEIKLLKTLRDCYLVEYKKENYTVDKNSFNLNVEKL